MPNAGNFEEQVRRVLGLDASGSAVIVSALPDNPAASSPAAEALAVVAPGQAPAAPATDALAAEMAALGRQLGTVQEAVQRQAESADRNTAAVQQGASSSARDVLGFLRDFAGGSRGLGGLGIAASPLVGLISRLFGGSDPEPAPLTPFALPDPVRLEAALSTGNEGLVPVAYSAGGIPRAAAAAPVRAAAAPSAITIQVQAIDSRSFLDHSDQIARAVREAMLNSHSLNDVIGEM